MKNNIGLFVTGIGIGIFLGLSDSPILLQVLVPFLTILSGLLSIFTGQKNQEPAEAKEGELNKFRNLSSIPMMLVVVGMVFGSFLGMLARNYDICSPAWLADSKKDPQVNVVVVPFEKGDTSILNNRQIIELINQAKNKSNIEKGKDLDIKGNPPKEEPQKIRANNSQSIPPKTNNSQTVLHESQEELCSKPNICILRGAELVSACRYVEHSDIKRIVRSPMINTDSLKFKINQICNCKQ